MHQRITVDMDKVDFASAFRQIARETAVNLISISASRSTPIRR